jgi:uncharacterized protein YpbB
MNFPVKNNGRVVSWVLEHIVQQQMEQHDKKVRFYEQCCQHTKKMTVREFVVQKVSSSPKMNQSSLITSNQLFYSADGGWGGHSYH